MNRIALINLIPQINVTNYLGFNQGLASLSAILKRSGHDTHLFTFSKMSKWEIERLNHYRPQALLIYLTTNQYNLFKHLMTGHFSGLQVPILVGGPHVSSCPNEVLRVGGVTAICIGEGDLSIHPVIERIERGDSFEGIPNIWYKEGSEIVENPIGACEGNLDSLPFPDREIFPYDQMLKERAIRLMGFEFMTSRGCIYSCRYCINALLRKINGSEVINRRRSVSHVVEEIQRVTRRYEYQGVIGFHDDIFTLDVNWLEHFSEAYRSTIGLPFWCNAHIHNLDERIIYTLRKSGCFRMHVGIECGNEQTRSQLLNKKITNEEILYKIKILRKHHIKVVTTFMIGLPDETQEQLQESIDLCRSIAPDWVLLSTFCPYPGTRLYNDLVHSKKIDPCFYKKMSSDTFYNDQISYPQSGLTGEQLSYYFRNFTQLAGIASPSGR